MTTVIRQDDLIESVADALQFISYYHPKDFIDGVYEAYQKEESQAAKDAMAQILINSRMCAQGHRPLCQDTGIVTVFVNIGMNVQWDCELPLDEVINEGVRRAYTHPDNVLRASILADPDGKRTNTKDNTPAIIHYKIVPGNTVDVHVAAKGGGSDEPVQAVFDLDAGEFRAGGSAGASAETGHSEQRHSSEADALRIDPEAETVLEDLRSADLAETSPVELMNRVREWQRRLDEE